MCWAQVGGLPHGMSAMILTRHSLARSEILLVMSTILRQFDLELFETTVEDVRVKHENFIPFVNMDSKGVRVVIK